MKTAIQELIEKYNEHLTRLMKSKEEIEQLAEKVIPLSNENIDYIEFANHDRKQWVNGYTQCQEDNSDKKYTEEDLRKAFNSGVSSGWNAQENKEAINADEYIQSLNKQD